MTDYLSRLAAKSLDAEKVIQPRLPGLFEPATNGQFMERSKAFGGIETSRLNMVETRPASSDPYPEGRSRRQFCRRWQSEK